MRRILDEFEHQKMPCENGELNRSLLVVFKVLFFLMVLDILVRIGSVPPDDESLCEYFHEFRVLSRIFQLIQKEPQRNEFNKYEIGKKILDNAKIILSTLNHCASSRTQSLKNRVDFIIIDEGEYIFFTFN